MNHTLKRLKPVIIAVLVLFTTSSLRLDLLPAATDTDTSDPQPGIKKEYSPAHKFQNLLKETEKLLEEIEAGLIADKSVSDKLSQLKQGGYNIHSLAGQLGAEFNKTRADLVSKKLPAEIIQRHDDFVDKFKTKLNTLQNNLKEIEKAEHWQLKTKIKAAKDHLKANIHKKKKTPSSKPSHRLKKLKQAPRQEDQASLKPSEENTLTASALAGGQSPKSSFLSRVLDFLTEEAEAASPQYAEYLGQSIEVQLTQEIIDLAASLDNSPLKIYEYVRNNFDYDPYYGSLKGAQETLWEGSGNDFDLSSLLIALLRASNVPCRYVYGTVDIPIEKAKNWVGGIHDPWMAANFLVTQEIPAITIVKGGQPSAVRIEHCWVEAFVDYIPSGGAIHKEGDTWIPLDPSFKEYRYVEGTDLSLAVPFDPDMFYLTELQGATPTELYYDEIVRYANTLGPELRHVLCFKSIQEQVLGILPASLPNNLIAKHATYSELPSHLRHKIQFIIYNSFFEPGIDYTISLPELNGKRLTLSYGPSTSSEEDLVRRYDGLFNVPAYLINVKPILRVEGEVKATGESIGMGGEQEFVIRIISPGGGVVDSISNMVTAGEYYGIGIDPYKVPARLLQERREQLYFNDQLITLQQTTTDQTLGELLYLEAMNYYYLIQKDTELSSRLMHLVYAKDISEAMVSFDISVDYLFGQPHQVTPAGIGIDADRNIITVIPPTDNSNKVKSFMILRGMMSSSYEHLIFEEGFEYYNITGVSAVKALKIAKALGIPVYQIDQTNIADILPRLGVSLDVIESVQNAVNQGLEVIIPETNIQVEQWAGVGWISQDPATGSGAYEISGLIAGGSSTDSSWADIILTIALFPLCISGCSSPSHAYPVVDTDGDGQPDLDVGKIVAAAKGLIGRPVNLASDPGIPPEEKVVCIDIPIIAYVTAGYDLPAELRKHYRNYKSQYADPTQKTDDPFLVRRVRNVYDFLKLKGLLYPNTARYQEGDIIFIDVVDNGIIFPAHSALALDVDSVTGIPKEIVMASWGAGTVVKWDWERFKTALQNYEQILTPPGIIKHGGFR